MTSSSSPDIPPEEPPLDPDSATDDSLISDRSVFLDQEPNAMLHKSLPYEIPSYGPTSVPTLTYTNYTSYLP